MSKKVLIATVKPFAPAAVDGIREIVEQAGYQLVLLEKYQDQQGTIEIVFKRGRPDYAIITFS